MTPLEQDLGLGPTWQQLLLEEDGIVVGHVADHYTTYYLFLYTHTFVAVEYKSEDRVILSEVAGIEDFAMSFITRYNIRNFRRRNKVTQLLLEGVWKP